MPICIWNVCVRFTCSTERFECFNWFSVIIIFYSKWANIIINCTVCNLYLNHVCVCVWLCRSAIVQFYKLVIFESTVKSNNKTHIAIEIEALQLITRNNIIFFLSSANWTFLWICTHSTGNYANYNVEKWINFCLLHKTFGQKCGIQYISSVLKI